MEASNKYLNEINVSNRNHLSLASSLSLAFSNMHVPITAIQYLDSTDFCIHEQEAIKSIVSQYKLRHHCKVEK